MQDLAINLVASVLAAAAAWLLQRAYSYRRLARMRGFFGLRPGAPSLLIVGRHWSSAEVHSVHRNDVAALVELGAIVKECGARSDVVPGVEAPHELGKVTEFCVGGSESNPRTAAHLAELLPGVEVTKFEDGGETVPFVVGGERFERRPYREAHVLVARTMPTAHPIFLVAGQTSLSNLAAARYLAGHYVELHRRYGERSPFCLVLRVREPQTYGPDLVELVADVSATAFGSGARVGAPRQRRVWRIPVGRRALGGEPPD